ncbi:4'-phosphopantetheinyl transferase family protein [Paracoccus siganidrum]|uniref:Enterobactin synthase component D n=2 Tax=Paracoccus siganidrum TaxID=1276757 RepID=A0A419A4E3_9RHOB|nr:4'-phosphopantetheinyl transferase superfamily protein [Paracoccus siganidrum]RJL09153.1 4'-phosphopantetheinyl transferase superfamily protein [Paracoccus siganidrum]RMC26544.1 4'-phosphopantetheinyl transferase [Paracoccus siganidrum]
MHRAPTDLLALATRDMPLPPGGGLVFVRVGGGLAFDLPEVIRRCAPRRQATFAAGRMAARDALRKAGHGGEPVPGIGGDGLPDWPAGWLGSISHSDDIAAALVAPDSGAQLLGLDVERIVTPEVAAQIAPEVMSGLSLGRSGQPPELEVTRTFSAKEALYKALYPLTRQFRDFSAARVGWKRAGPGDPCRVRLTLTEDWGMDWPAGTTFEAVQRIAAGHVATILWR